MASEIDLNSPIVYINGLTVNGNLTVEGTLYMARFCKFCPNDVHETIHRDIVYDSDVVFKGDLHLAPKGKINIKGTIKSGNFRNCYSV
tara:strand:+ start:3904 stop:4167 length:264 start_codon:yes stop_codon:yes gene_type:complete